jgi:hypothetical protein
MRIFRYKEAKASEGDSPRMSENTVSRHYRIGNAYYNAKGFEIVYFYMVYYKMSEGL